MRSWAMCTAGAIAAAATAFVLTACAAQSPDSALSVRQEQVTIYEAVLGSWLGKSQGHQLVAEQLSAPPSKEELSQCKEPLNIPVNTTPLRQRQSLAGVKLKRSGVELIDEAKWKPADPGPAIANGKSVDAAVREGFSRSLISFSQIVLSSDEKDAVVKISMVCGSLCGSGSTLHLRNRATGWSVIDRCGGSWMS